MEGFKSNTLSSKYKSREDSTNSSQTSLKVKTSSEYPGLFSTRKKGLFDKFSTDPLYKFPVVDKIFKPQESTRLNISSFTRADSVCLKDSLAYFHEQSPFRRGNTQDAVNFVESSSHDPPHNSFAQHSYTSFMISRNSAEKTPFNLAEEMAKESLESAKSSSSESSYEGCTPEKADISVNTKEAILNLHRKFQSKREDERHLHSITPASSLESGIFSERPSEVSLPPNKADSHISISSLHSDEVIFNPGNEEISLIDWEEKKKPTEYSGTILEEEEIGSSEEGILNTSQNLTYEKQDANVELLPEDEEEDSEYMYQSLEALRKAKLATHAEEDTSAPEDEGPIRVSISNRLFLNGQPASRTKFSKLDSPFKPVKNSETSFESIKFVDVPDPNSPLVKKVVIFEENAQPHLVESRKNKVQVKPVHIVHSIPTAGFTSAPSLEFWSEDFKSRATTNTNPKQALVCLLSEKILKDLQSLSVRLISCGFEHCAAVTQNGKVFTWGYGASGCLGHGDTSTYSSPTEVTSISNVAYLECGGYHNAAVTEEGELFVWGRGDVHQLGIRLSKLSRDEVGHVALKPLKVDYFHKKRIRLSSVACGEAHTLALSSEGTVYCFGWAEDGQLGLRPEDLKQNMMTFEIKPLPLHQKVVKVSAGSLFSCCLTSAGQVYVWGNGEQGQLGLGSRVKLMECPTLVTSLKHEVVLDIVCGETHVLCVTELGRVFAWGQGVVGRFEDVRNFPKGSDIVCFVPRELCFVDIMHRFIVPKYEEANFETELEKRLRELLK